MSSQAQVLLLSKPSSALMGFTLMIDSFITPKKSSCQGIALLQKKTNNPKTNQTNKNVLASMSGGNTS